ncbi:MAG: hypothetical protein WC404_00080 [Candidatus Omnitrophota bacterium]|jgi:hypothetical protein
MAKRTGKKVSLVGWIWKRSRDKNNKWYGGIEDKNLVKKSRTLSGVETKTLTFYVKKPWNAQKVHITIEEI